MKMYSRNVLAAIALTLTQSAGLPAQDTVKPDVPKVDAAKTEPVEPVKPAKPTRAELRDKQLDVSLEARDIERVLGKLKKASDLAKQRMTEAAKVAETASTSLEKGDSKAARDEAQQTAEMFQEIVKQLEALLKEETPQRIAEARQLAQQLAKAEREFAEKFEGALNPVQAMGKGKVNPKSQVAPIANPDMKAQGSGAKTEAKGSGKGQGKNGEKPDERKDSNQTDRDGKQRDDKDGDKNGDKPMPDGQGGSKPDDKNKTGEGDEKKPNGGSGEDPDAKKPGGGAGQDQDETKEGDEKKPGGGAGKDKDESKEGDEQKPGGAGSAKYKKDDKPADDQDSSDGDKPSDKNRDGSGDGSDKDQKSDKNRDGGGTGLTAEQLRQMVADRADKLTETGRTLQDVLNEIAKSTDPNDKEAVAKIQAVMKEIDINKIVAEMAEVSNLIRSQKDTDAKLSSLDISERLEIMAQRLDAAYRGIVAPQAEELRKLEAQLADLREQLEKLETPSQVAAWHREVRELLDQLDKLGVSPKDRELLEKEMVKAGFGLDADRTKRAVNWGVVNGYYTYPVNYNHALIHIQEDVQERIQSLILGDLGNVSDEATPPKYQELVERYYEVLSRSGKPGSAAKAPPAGKSEMRKSKGTK